jgi:4'-phosphopantetheinyl transferase
LELESLHFSERIARTILGAEELARCERVIDPCRRRRLLLARAALRLILAGQLGCDPSSARIVRLSSGRPVLLGRSAPSFSFSHSGGWVAVAVSSLARVGVDIEQTSRQISGALIDRLLTRGEIKSLPDLSPAGAGEALLLHWTAKEACAKVLVGGLASNLDRLELREGASERPRLLDPALSDVAVSRLDVCPALVGALAGTQTTDRELHDGWPRAA